MSRKPIQIAATPETEDGLDCCFALCDDGSIWILVQPGSRDDMWWRRLPDVPDDETE